MANADDHCAPLPTQLVNLGLRARIKLVICFERIVCHVLWIARSGGRGRGEPKEAYFGAIRELKDLVWGKARLARLLVHDVGRQEGEGGSLLVFGKRIVAPVKLMISNGHEVIPTGIHEGDGGHTFGCVHKRHALRGVSRVNEQHLVSLVLPFGLEGSDGSHGEVTLNVLSGLHRNIMAMGVVGVDDGKKRRGSRLGSALSPA